MSVDTCLDATLRPLRTERSKRRPLVSWLPLTLQYQNEQEKDNMSGPVPGLMII